MSWASMMKHNFLPRVKLSLTLVLVLALQACGGGGGGSSSSPSSAPAPVVTQPNSTVDYTDNMDFNAAITSATVDANAIVTVEFQVTDKEGVGIVGLSAADLRFIVAKLNAMPSTNLSGNWQSYINRIEQPGIGPGRDPKLQATTEPATQGQLTDNSDGTYTYRFSNSLRITDPDILAQAETEGLDLDYQPERTHRVALQVSNAANAANPTFDWQPSTGQDQFDGIFSNNIVATQTCNNCHGNLALHGGGRVEVKYCVTCHNPGSTDANSGNTVSFKNMVHKIHRGKALPSVVAGGVYQIYGYRDSLHDYSTVGYPNDILACTDCHAGNATAGPDQVITQAGDNWREVASRESCGSCHDDVDFDEHFGGQQTDMNCMNCHQINGVAGTIESRHRNLVREARGQFDAQILAINDTAPGQFPRIQFSVTNPQQDDQPYNILSDPEWTNSDSSLRVGLAWSTTDYTNTGNQADNASSVLINALANATPVGDGTFIVTSEVAIPDGTLAPNISATGSGAVNIEGHPIVNVSIGGEPDNQRVPLTNVSDYFSIDEASGEPQPRRNIVELESCLNCHGQLVMHGSNRNDNIEGCVMCHNPRNTDRSAREMAANPPTDGKQEESLDFKTMIHGIHAAGIRNNPLQIVGYRGFTTYVYDEDHVRYPNNVGNCLSCHTDTSYQLPLAATVLATTFDTGDDRADPSDDRVKSPTASVCSSCHDGNSAIEHMLANGADFDTTQDDINAGIVLEQCEICHGAGRTYDVKLMHPIDKK